MRVPIPVVLLLCLAVVGGVWWNGTRNADFLTPPPETKLAMIRAKVASSLPPADHPDATISTPVQEPQPDPQPQPSAEETKPSIELGDLNNPPVLQEYADHALKGAGHLIDLAVLLEAEGEFQRALLAWERVLDLGDHNDSQVKTAIAAIKRLRPTLPPWNTDTSKAITITLNAGTGKKNIKILKPVLEETAREIERASSGILRVSTNLTTSKDGKAASSAPAPVAVWFTGRGKETRATEVMSFTFGTPETLPEDLRKTAFNLLRGFIGQGSSRTPPEPLAEGEPALDALNSHVTRLYWKVLGNLLNQPPEKPPEKKQ